MIGRQTLREDIKSIDFRKTAQGILLVEYANK